MKRTRLVIIGLGIALLCTVILYDIFAPHSTEMINASGGQLDIDITNAEIGFVSEFVEISPSSVVVKNDNKTVEIGVHNLYSSSETNVSIEITNTGVLPVTFIWIKQDVSNIIDTKTNKAVSVDLLQDLLVEYHLYSRTRKSDYVVVAEEAIATSEKTMKALEGSNTVFQPGESLRLDVKIMVGTDSSRDIENKSFIFSITPFFIQAY
jgi:hypothetical protein